MGTVVVRKNDVEVNNTDWGSLQWLVTGQAGSSEHMTVGRVTFKPGQANPLHQHPNCDEILVVIQGEIEHTLPEGGTVRLSPGDCIVMKQGGMHQARNVGDEEAVVIVAFNSPIRETVGE